MFLLVSVRHVGAHPGEHGVSIQISISLVKHFFGYLVYEIFLWPESWRGSLYIYLLSFPRFWTLSIERSSFLVWSILNSVTLKTNHMFSKRPKFTFAQSKRFPPKHNLPDRENNSSEQAVFWHEVKVLCCPPISLFYTGVTSVAK